MWCSVGVMLLSGAQHNLANIYDTIKNKLANVNKNLCSLRYWGVMLLVYISKYNPQPIHPTYTYLYRQFHLLVRFWWCMKGEMIVGDGPA